MRYSFFFFFTFIPFFNIYSFTNILSYLSARGREAEIPPDNKLKLANCLFDTVHSLVLFHPPILLNGEVKVLGCICRMP